MTIAPALNGQGGTSSGILSHILSSPGSPDLWVEALDTQPLWCGDIAVHTTFCTLQVALTFGFKLRISNPYGVESSPSIFTGAAAGPSGASTGASEPGVEPPEDQATAGVGLEGVEQGSSTQPAVGAAGAHLAACV